MPIAITQEQRDLTDSVRDWALRAEPRVTLREHESGPRDGTELAAALAELGLFGIAVPESHGGAEGTLADLAAGIEQSAAALVPGAVLGTALAGIVLSEVADSQAAQQLVPDLVEGKAHATVALPGQAVDGEHATDELAGTWTAQGELQLRGTVRAVPDADEQSHLVLPVRVDGELWWCLLAPGRAGVTVTPGTPFDFSRAVADISLDDARVSGAVLLTGVEQQRVRDLALTLTCAEAAGVADECVRIASEHAKVREQFGRPVGQFQAVKHMCAEMLCRAELAGALAWDAARADGDPQQHSLAAATAAAYALDAAVDNAKDCIQVLGGIGFTWEHDAHLYLRRATALRARFGGSSRWRRTASAWARDGHRRTIEIDASQQGDSTANAQFADQARAVAEDIAALPESERRSRLVETGYLMPHWPKPYGVDATPAQQLAIDAALDEAGVTRPDMVIGTWAIPTILQHGTAEQQQRLVEPTLRGEVVWCQLFSEPGAGSDLASLRTSARRVDGGWVLSGQKVWTSLAETAHWAICLARTDQEASKHAGLTYFLVRMDAPGVTVRPLREITGRAVFNEVFLDETFVPDTDVVGEPGEGWRLARTTLANERVSLTSGSALGEGVERLISADGNGAPVDPDTLGGLVAQGSAASLLELRATLRRLAGHQPGAESSVSKLVGVRHRQQVAETSLDTLGTAASAVDEHTSAAQHEFLLSRCLSIAGGTTQVLLNVVGERLLGLPR